MPGGSGMALELVPLRPSADHRGALPSTRTRPRGTTGNEQRKISTLDVVKWCSMFGIESPQDTQLCAGRVPGICPRYQRHRLQKLEE
ncbi:signal peptide protein [Anopheles sinensis]|uniref:Signal peptide protein n=1 Tax=Anopheles sinensis TaxID=74873 RepID=A0A084WJW9_ANOSI|nr:signal peptide protein [Anopheles sinensis]